jgi:hypothetical protein
MRVLFLALLVIVAACDKPHLGLCDVELEEMLVFEGAGLPAFDGQAQMEISCANACHVTGVPDRMGAPHGFDFNVVGSITNDPTMPDEMAVLAVQQTRAFVFGERYEIYGSVETGRMPPAEAGATVTSGIEYFYANDMSPVPPIATEQGLLVFRRWLACGAPMVERSAPSRVCTDPMDPGTCEMRGEPGAPCSEAEVGDYCFNHNDAEPVEPIFSEIFEKILNRRCAACHSGRDPDNGMLDFSDEDMAWASLQGAADGSDCEGQGNYLVPMNPDASLLVQKLEPMPVCGARMPSERGLAPTYAATIRQWIADGATR